jgi:uncharacterized membrane protein
VLQRVQSWEAITNGGIGTIAIIGATVIAGSEPQAEDRIRYRADIAADGYWPEPPSAWSNHGVSRIDDAKFFKLGDSLQRLNERGISMSDLIAIVYPSEAKAEEVRQRLFKLQKEYLIKLSDAVIAVKTEAGPVKLNQLVNMTAAGAASGSFWGLLIGVLFLNPILGVALGAASGALGGALADYGINDAFMKELSANLQPGNAALFVLIQEMTADKVLKEIQDAGGVVLKTSLDDSKEKLLRDALAKATAAESAAPPASST